jgi:hypothetical protein
MTAKLIKNCALAATLFVVGGSWSLAADSGAAAAAAAKSAATAAKPADNIQRAKEQLAAYTANRDKMLEQLRTANAEQQKAILEKMEEQKQAMIEASRELAKQAREDIRKQRQSGVPPKR